MPNRRNLGTVRGQPFVGGAGFTPGCWRADPPTGTVAVPEGPQAPIVRPDEPEHVAGGRLRDPRTAANLAARDEALKPRRWRPS